MLVDLFHWSLADIDATELESLLTFVFHYPHWKEKQGKAPDKAAYVDQVDWL